MQASWGGETTIHARRSSSWRESSDGVVSKRYGVGGWRPGTRSGLEDIRLALARTHVKDSSRWESDVADIPSQDEVLAWRTYGRMLSETTVAYETVVYGRWGEGPSGTSLQY